MQKYDVPTRKSKVHEVLIQVSAITVHVKQAVVLCFFARRCPWIQPSLQKGAHVLQSVATLRADIDADVQVSWEPKPLQDLGPVSRRLPFHEHLEW